MKIMGICRECRRCYSKQGVHRVQILMGKEIEKIQRHALPWPLAFSLISHVIYVFLPGINLLFTTTYTRASCNAHAGFYSDTPLIGKDEYFRCKAVVFNTVSIMCWWWDFQQHSLGRHCLWRGTYANWNLWHY